MAKVFPVFKSGQKTDPSNYRAISILPTLSKIFEKHVNKHTIGYLNKLIHERQSGFRHKHSCQTALVKSVDQWINCVDQEDLVGTMFIDFHKAFNMVDHSLRISKLSAYTFSTSTISWCTSYLDTRLEAIKSEHGLSEFSQTLSEVPQGSILGSTLFLLSINDLPLSIKHCSADFFADDSTSHIPSKSKIEIESKLQSDGTETGARSKRNKLPINYGKSTTMVVGTRQKLSNKVALHNKRRLSNYACKITKNC